MIETTDFFSQGGRSAGKEFKSFLKIITKISREYNDPINKAYLIMSGSLKQCKCSRDIWLKYLRSVFTEGFGKSITLHNNKYGYEIRFDNGVVLDFQHIPKMLGGSHTIKKSVATKSFADFVGKSWDLNEIVGAIL